MKCKNHLEEQQFNNRSVLLFEKLKKIFTETAKNLSQKGISEKEINSILNDLEISLMENDVAHEIASEMTSKIKLEILNLKLARKQNPDEVITTKLFSFLNELFLSIKKIDIIQSIVEKKKSKKGTFSIIFLGINGTGKTTTVAKFCKLLRNHGISVVLAAADTHRAGAIEQITQHGNNLNTKVISQRYGADPSAVARDAVEHAKKNYIDVVLIDTAGRMQTSKNLMEEIHKIIRVVKPDMKIFVGDSLSGNDTVNQAKEFFQYTNYDGSILTKSDADSKGGAAISITYLTHKPILYLGVGQGYGDLAEFDHNKFLDSIFTDRIYIKTNNNLGQNEVNSSPGGDQVDELNPDLDLQFHVSKSRDDEYHKLVTKNQDISTSIESKSKYLLSNQIKDDKTINKEINECESKPKKNLILSRFFKNKEKEDVENILNKEINSEKSNKNKKEKEKEKGEEGDVVYLTDDDIDDLIK